MKELIIFLVLIVTLSYVTPVTSYETPEQCNFCEVVFGTILTVLNDSRTEGEVENAIDLVCKLFPKSIRQKCFDAAKKLATFIATIPKLAAREEFTPFALCSMYEYCQVQCCVSKAPEQVHIALGYAPSKMSVNWVTADKVDSIVMYGTSANNLNLKATGTVKTYTNGGWAGWIHEVVLTDLLPSQQYFYKAGSDQSGYSKVFNFYTEKPFINGKTPVKVAVYGDMGADPEAVPNINRLAQLVAAHEIDFIIHDGDISYADGFQQRWDKFMRLIEDVAANTPYMVTPGNHEIGIIGLLNVTIGYNSRFTLPGEHAQTDDLENLYYSWNYGNAHFVAIDTESILNIPRISSQQHAWLEQDLKAVDRKRYPWVIVFGHRPLYCSNPDGLDCAGGDSEFSRYLRNALEPLFFKYQVDIVVTAHKHDYERMWPVYQTKPVLSYNNPKVPIYIVSGAGGNREGNTGFGPTRPNWSAKAISDWGFGILTIFNNTHLNWSFYQQKQTAVSDSFTLFKPY